MLQKNQIYEAVVADYTVDGQGIARVEGCAVFVPNVLRGERVRLRIEYLGKTHAIGKALEILERSPHRVNRECPDAKRCGGCDFWHMDYEEECDLKRRRVLDALNRLGGQSLSDLTLHGAPTCAGYRNKAQFPVSVGKSGVYAGFFERGTHKVVPIERCRIQPSCADEARKIVCQWANRFRVPAYDEISHTGLLRHIYVRYGAKTGEVLVCIVANAEKLPHENELAQALFEGIPNLRGVVLNTNTKKGNAVLGEKMRVLRGADAIEDELCGLRFRISPRSFYQVNRDQAEALYEKALEFADLHGTETVLDLYCGTGTITLCLAQRTKSAIGVEIIDAAIEDAKKNAERNGVKNARFFCADAGQAAKTLAGESTRPEVIVLDPPRKGVGPEVIEAIAQMSPERVVYVSCDPATLARDVKRLSERGYRLEKAEAFDLFPRCAHVETVALLSRQINVHNMRLNSSPFEMIKSGGKDH